MAAGLALCACMLGASALEPWNAPYPLHERERGIFYSTFQERPKHLDPVSSYSENEALFTGQIYEPPLQYHYLKRPYMLVPLSVREVPTPQYFDAAGRRLPDSAAAKRVARAVYRLRVVPGIRFAPHPALARDADGSLRYHAVKPAALRGARDLSAFRYTGTRELVAADFVHQVKRLAHPGLHSPILGLMREYIVGLGELADALAAGEPATTQVDLRDITLEGARVVDRYTFEITLRRKYPQFVYWLAMPFFSPVPWEADAFFGQPGMRERNLSLDWFPVGTGPYMLVENNPNRRMVLVRNPSFRGEAYPRKGEEADRAQGLLADAGERMPFIDEAHFILEREDIPEWSKFLQGYYDTSPIVPDGFDQAVRFDAAGRPETTPLMRSRRIRLHVATQVAISYTGFNMLDPVVGGSGRRARLLRRAIAIAVDFEEMISIFGNGRGLPAHGPLPPGIFGHRDGRAGINPWVYRWRHGYAQRRTLDEARALLQEAGYAGGMDPVRNAPLVLSLDVISTGTDARARFAWYRKQLGKLGIDLVIRSTDYNRFQDKMRKGQAQLFTWGWNADYPDPENFLFLLHGPNGKTRHQGENAANYESPAFDALFERMRSLPNGPARQDVIDRMLARVREDGPWLWGFHPQAYSLQHAWMGNAKPNLMARNTLKYRRLDASDRVARQREWNMPHWEVPVLAGMVAVALLVPLARARRRRREATAA